MSTVAEYAQRVRSARTWADRQAGEARAVGQAGQRAVAERDALLVLLEQHERVIALLTRTGEELQDTAQRQIEELVTRGLQVVFDPTISFHLVPSTKAGQANLDFIIRTTYSCTWCGGRGRDNDEAGSPCAYCKGKSFTVIDTPVMEARGGGMAAVTCSGSWCCS
jgi:DnaJ-class molecular chaperone